MNPLEMFFFSYKMDGVDNDWQVTNEISTQYTTLPPGNYTFSVRTKINFNSWSEPISIQFNISPPWWDTLWAKTIMVLIVISIIYLLVLFRFQIRQKQIGLELQSIQSEQKALRAQLNPHFFFNALNSVQHYIIQNDSKSSMRFLSKFTKLMRQVLDNSGKTLITLQQEIEILSTYIDLEVMRFRGRMSYHIEIDENINPELLLIPSMLIQPHVENAIQHGLAPLKEGGKLIVRFHLKDDGLECLIEDNGVGRAASKPVKSKKHQSMGSQLTNDRIQLMNVLFEQKLQATIEDVIDVVGQTGGTRVIFLFPIKKA